MTALRWWMVGLLGWLATLGSGLAQLSELWPLEDENPPAPATMVWDREDLLARKPESLQRISAQLEALKAEFGFSIYLVIQSGLDSPGAANVAATLQNLWVPDRNGLVVVCETDNGTIGFGKAYMTDFEFGSKIPSFETAVLITQTMRSMARKRIDEVYLEELVGKLVAGVRGYLKRADVPPPAVRTVRFGLFAVGAVAALALIGLLAVWLLRTADQKRPKFYYFGKVELPERLGAPFGGGCVSTRRFR